MNFPGTRRRTSLPTLPTSTAILITASLILPGFSEEVRGETWFADAGRPDDTGDGLSWDSAKRTVGATLAASAVGDTILVKYGIYPVGDALVLTGNRCLGSDDGTHSRWDEALPDSGLCVISADVTCRVMSITGSAVTSATIIRGFTLTGGDASTESAPRYGGGMDISGGADPVVERCRVTGNLAGHNGIGYGGGISVRGAGTAAEIRYCRIDNNLASNADAGYGGGIRIGDGAQAGIHHCTIVDNRGSNAHGARGGGLALQGGEATIEDCLIAFNVAATATGLTGAGGGIYAISGTLVAQRCEITDNVAAEASCRDGTGGGAYLVGLAGTGILDSHIARNIASRQGKGNGGGVWAGSGQVIRGCLIDNNTATLSNLVSTSCNQGRGGGVGLTDSNSDLRDNVIRDNVASTHAEGFGGGIYFDSANRIERNVVWGNVASAEAAGWGGGIYTGAGPSTSLRNNTVVRNANTLSPGGGGAGSGFCHGTYSGWPTVENNIFCDHDVAGSDGVGVHSQNAMTISYNSFYNNGGGNYNGLITSNEEQVGDPRFTDGAGGDFTLRYDSPCIETGNPATPVPENGAWRVDIGSAEYTGTRHARTITGAGEYLFGGRVKAKVAVIEPGTLSSLDMFVFPGTRHPLAPGSVERYYTIDTTGGGALFDLTLSYLDAELDGNNEANLRAWRRGDGSWEGPKEPVFRDAATNWITLQGETAFSDWVLASNLDVSAAPDADDPAGVRPSLAPNRPNPFSRWTQIRYRVARADRVRLAVFDARGRQVRVLVDGETAEGEYILSWDGRSADGLALPDGLYFIELRAHGERQVLKALLAR